MRQVSLLFILLMVCGIVQAATVTTAAESAYDSLVADFSTAEDLSGSKSAFGNAAAFGVAQTITTVGALGVQSIHVCYESASDATVTLKIFQVANSNASTISVPPTPLLSETFVAPATTAKSLLSIKLDTVVPLAANTGYAIYFDTSDSSATEIFKVRRSGATAGNFYPGGGFYDDGALSSGGRDAPLKIVSPPPGAVNPDPADGETGVEIDLSQREVPGTFSWDAPVGPRIVQVFSYSVYIDPNETKVANATEATTGLAYKSVGQTGISFDPGENLTNEITYYWRVDPKVDFDYVPGTTVEDANVIAGPIWSFETIALNTAPIVDAGEFAIVDWEIPYTLTGSYTDDGKPVGGPVTITWSAADPAQDPNILFDNASVLNPNVTFNAPGVYELQLEVNDGWAVGTDTVWIRAKDASQFNALQAHWKFDDANDVDDAYYQFTSMGGSPTFNDANAISGKCLELDAGEYLTFGKQLGAETSLTIALWMMPRNGVVEQYTQGMIYKMPFDTVETGGWNLQWRKPDEMRFRLGPASEALLVVDTGDDSDFALDQWVHVACTFDAETGTMSFYQNSILMGTQETSLTSFDPLTELTIGTKNPGSSRLWAGLIDEVYLYDYPLDSAAIRALMVADGGNLPPIIESVDNVLYKGDVNMGIPISIAYFDEEQADTVVLEILEGPAATVTYSNVVIDANSASFDAAFDTIGDYSLRVVVTDPAGLTAVSDAFVVKVRDAGFSGLEAYFPFDSDLNSSAVTGGVAYAGTAVGGAVVGAGGKVGSGGLILDGLDDYVDYNIYLGAEHQITLAFWVKRDAGDIGSEAWFVNKWADDNNSPTDPQSGRGFFTRVRSADNYSAMIGSDFGLGVDIRAPEVPGLALGAEQWYHLALTYDAAQVKIYQDGVLVDLSDTDTYSPADIVSLFAIGCRREATSTFFDGVIDELRVYDYALTQAQIKAQILADDPGFTFPSPCISEALAGDFTTDCYVNLDDLLYLADTARWVIELDLDNFADLASTWLDCVDPSNTNCL